MAFGTPDYDESDRDWMDALDEADNADSHDAAERACSAGINECEPGCPAFGKAVGR